ncbi:MurR/RpiR family transcriptional regulator [Streptomyces xiamenensis]
MAARRKPVGTETGTAKEAPRGAEAGQDGTGPATTVAERIRREQGGFSPGERKIARALMSHYPAAGLESTSGLAERAGVSPPTVVRFVVRLGFGGYREFQQSLRDEVQARRASPLTLTPLIGDGTSASEITALTADVGSAVIGQTFSALPTDEFNDAVRLICDKSMRVSSFGGRFSQLMAQYLDLHLRLLRPGTGVHQPGPGQDAGFLVDLGRRDVCVVFDFRRYQRDTIELARFAHGRKARIVLVTDPWLSPIAEFADVVLPARVESPSLFDSLVAPTALVEALVAAARTRLGEAAVDRMAAADRAWSSLTTD